jgi:hypothetical protein
MSSSERSIVSSENPLEAWYLHDRYTIVQAALLAAGHDPAAFENVEKMAW